MRTFSSISAIAVLAAICFLPTSASAVEYNGIGGKPAFPRADNDRTQSIFIHTVEVGQVVKEGVEIVNNSNVEKIVEVYGVDDTPSSDGAFACAQAADAKVSVGTWITLEKNELTLAPGTRETVPFTITIPEDADVGEHNGCIVIQEKNPAEFEEGGIHLTFRSAMRVALTIPGELVRSVELTNIQANTNNTVPQVTVAVKNTGNVSADTMVDVKLTSLFGTTVQTFSNQYPVLRNQAAQWNYDIQPSYWGGWYKAAGTITYNADEGSEIGDTMVQATTSQSLETDWFFMMPTTQALVIEISVAVVVLLLLIISIWLAVRNAKFNASLVDYKVKSKDTIQTIAEAHGISWKRLAKANRLKAPYTLSKDQTIRVPGKKQA